MSKTRLKLVHPKTFEEPLCAEVGPTFFYLDDDDDDTVSLSQINNSYKTALEICAKCSHITDCAEWGIQKERWGVWGGLTPPQRANIRRKRNITLKDAY